MFICTTDSLYLFISSINHLKYLIEHGVIGIIGKQHIVSMTWSMVVIFRLNCAFPLNHLHHPQSVPHSMYYSTFDSSVDSKSSVKTNLFDLHLHHQETYI